MIHFGSQRLDLLSNLPDFCSNACQLNGTWCRKILIGHRLNWVRIGHVVLVREAVQEEGPPREWAELLMHRRRGPSTNELVTARKAIELDAILTP